MKPIFTIIAVVVLGLAGSGLMLAQGTADQFVGTWKLSLAMSKFSGMPAPTSETRKVEAQGNGYKFNVEGIAADGKAIAYTFTSNLDGKVVPVTGWGIPGESDIWGVQREMIASQRGDSNTITTTATKAGKVVLTIRTVVSKDGRVTTITANGTDTNGQPVSYVAVFDKQ
jgi:hypothetical protein